VTRFDGRVAPVAVSTRSGMEESVHHGAGVAIGSGGVDGGVNGGVTLATIGDPDLVVYPRSCLKPMQAHAMVTLGLELADEQLAVACASHDGSAAHLEAVRSILARFGLAESDLANTAARPSGPVARAAARVAGVEPSSLQQNCSGKHAAMLATCRVNGWSIDDYLDPDHPLQVAITAGIESLGARIHHVGIDGCGAPTHALSLRDLAGAFAALAAPGSLIARAMTGHPSMVAGPARDVTLWMQAVPTLVAKEGAAGVMAAGLADGRAIAFKVADGSDASRQAVVAEALRAVGVDVDGIAPSTVERVAVPVLGHGRAVGRIDPVEWTRCSS
jgi:L-asparaginase II